MDVINQVAVTVPPNSEKIIMVRTDVDTRGNQCSIFEPQVVSTPGILIARSLVKPDETGNVPIRVANILDQSITLQSNTLLGKLTPVAWVAGITQRRPSSSDTSKLPEELQELLNRSSNDLSSGEVKELGQFLHLSLIHI